jgi:hypothetical protein
MSLDRSQNSIRSASHCSRLAANTLRHLHGDGRVRLDCGQLLRGLSVEPGLVEGQGEGDVRLLSGGPVLVSVSHDLDGEHLER